MLQAANRFPDITSLMTCPTPSGRVRRNSPSDPLAARIVGQQTTRSNGICEHGRAELNGQNSVRCDVTSFPSVTAMFPINLYTEMEGRGRPWAGVDGVEIQEKELTLTAPAINGSRSVNRCDVFIRPVSDFCKDPQHCCCCIR
ncbi:hypothetical protein AVEN_110350-1 [Araneus ventricosus]|uniref:Uncharacterized protein n=1 Tax=Araneus ventricosus TaxID=182803 RepID=A0A4Y2EPJ6_ARAVE|nr:hypothetical protein AVEN_110350-1 [Araneus ventricosus]